MWITNKDLSGTRTTSPISGTRFSMESAIVYNTAASLLSLGKQCRWAVSSQGSHFHPYLGWHFRKKMDSVGLCPQAEISTFHVAVWLQGESRGLYFKDWFNISLQRKRVWSGKTFKCGLLSGQGNVNDSLAACHRPRICTHAFPSFWWLWQCRLQRGPILVILREVCLQQAFISILYLHSRPIQNLQSH